MSAPRASSGTCAPSGLITLLTDFGLQDPFVGIMKGVIAARFAAARVIDLCHGILPQRVAEGAFWLERSFRWFPPGTVHVAVVDPGVGSARRALVVHASGHYFVGPDNGLLSGPLSEAGCLVRSIDLDALALPEPSRTFHGRDVFAPVAAGLANGELAFSSVGPAFSAAQRDALPQCRVSDDRVDGEVVTVDRFGNLITSIDAAAAAGLPQGRLRVAGASCRRVGTYAEAAAGELVTLLNAFSTLEIAVPGGSAQALLRVARGEAVSLSND